MTRLIIKRLKLPKFVLFFFNFKGFSIVIIFFLRLMIVFVMKYKKEKENLIATRDDLGINYLLLRPDVTNDYFFRKSPGR